MFLLLKIPLFLIVTFACREITGYAMFGTTVKPAEDDIRNAYNITSWIVNETAREMVVQYLVLCPEQDMCLGDDFKRKHVFDMTMTPSCSSCDCDESCLRKSSCCPSKFLQIANVSSNIDSVTADSRQNNSNSKVPLTCLTPFWNIHSEFHGTSYWMVDVCPNGESCSPDRNLWRNMTLFTPVTSISTNETYRYRECALCNGEEEKALQTWKQDQIVCRTRADLLSAKVSSDVFVDEPDEIATCNILFYPPSTVQGSEISCISFDRVLCNQSGTLDSDQAFLFEACDAFNIPYSTPHSKFKNIYCALCNVVSMTELPIEYKKDVGYGPSDTFPVFSALIDFKENIKPAYETPDEMVCAPDKIYNQQLGVCFDLVCEAEYKIIHDSDQVPFCQPLYPQWGENNYEINLIFQPTQEQDATSLQTMDIPLNAYLENKMTLSNLSDYICSLQYLFLESKRGGQLGVMIELTIPHAHDLNGMIEKLFNTFANDEEILLTNVFEGTSTNVSGFIIGQRFHLYEEDKIISTIHFRQYIDPLTYKTLFSIYAVDNTMNRPVCLKSSSTVVVADWYRCPKVRITTRDTMIIFHKNFTVCLPQLNLCVPSRYYKKSPNNQEIDICYDWYSRLAVSEPLYSQPSVFDDVNAYLSLTCLSLSTGGSILTIVSYCVRSGPLSSAGSNIVILSIFLISANTVYSLSKFLAFSKLLCLITGILVHFLWLSVMFWMSLSSFMIFNSFTNFSNVAFKQKSSLLRLLLVNCSLCSLFIVTNVIISHYSTGGENFGYSTSTCYIADPSMILYTFVLPVGAAVCVNTFMFIVTVSRIYQKEEVRKSRDQKRVSAYFRLSTLTGVSWCFGFLAQMTSLEVFSFLHTVFGAGQGVFLYLAFGLPLGFKCNPVHTKSTESSNTPTSHQ